MRLDRAYSFQNLQGTPGQHIVGYSIMEDFGLIDHLPIKFTIKFY